MPASSDIADQPSNASTTHKLLGGNGRIVALTLSACVLAVAMAIAAIAWGSSFVKFVGCVTGLITLPTIWFAWQFYTQPRMAITDAELWVYLLPNFQKPFRIPLESVEVFFIGQGAVSGTEPGHPDGYGGAVAANVIVRLAESAKEWHHRDVHLLLGVWDEGYITVRGLFCENIDQDVLKTMNRELMNRKRKLRMTSGAPT